MQMTLLEMQKQFFQKVSILTLVLLLTVTVLSCSKAPDEPPLFNPGGLVISDTINSHTTYLGDFVFSLSNNDQDKQLSVSSKVFDQKWQSINGQAFVGAAVAGQLRDHASCSAQIVRTGRQCRLAHMTDVVGKRNNPEVVRRGEAIQRGIHEPLARVHRCAAH